jgi:hypothetical protein
VFAIFVLFTEVLGRRQPVEKVVMGPVDYPKPHPNTYTHQGQNTAMAGQ